MKRGSQILLEVTLFLIVLSVSATFYKTVILQDFEIVTIEEEGGDEEDDASLEEAPVSELEATEEEPTEPLSVEGEEISEPELDI